MIKPISRLAGAVFGCSLVIAAPGYSAGRESSLPPSTFLQVEPLEMVMLEELEPIDHEALLTEDAAVADLGPGPLRFADPEDVAITPRTHGTWEVLDDGSRLWRLRISSPHATDLNFGFTRFRLPEGATLHILSEGFDRFLGPYDSTDNRGHGELWTAALAGNRAVIELHVPAVPAYEPELVLGRIGRGYRGLFRTSGSVAKQGSCNVDVVCGAADGYPWVDDWRDEIQSAAQYSIQGSLACSGSLIMDAAGSFRPYFLTAHHCGVTSANDQTVVTYWNVQSATCGALAGGSRSQSLSGSTLIASRRDVDFSLLELDSAPPREFNPYWAGWDRRTDHTPQGSVAIHHAQAEEKVISLNDDPLTLTNNCDPAVSSDIGTHWEVDNWEEGTTERGSSGGGLWDPDTHLLVGSLTGGTASCTNTSGYDCFSRIAVAWDGDVPEERLRDWLDPHGTGVLTVEGVTYLTAGIARTAGAAGTNWRSKVTLLNRSGGTASTTVSYVHESGTISASVNLMDGELVGWDNVLEDLFRLSGDSSGALKVESNRQLVVTARTYNLTGEGTFGQFLPAVTSSEAIGTGQIGVISQLTKNPSFRTNIGFINLSLISCQVQVQLYDSLGVPVGSARTLDVGPLGFKQETNIFGKAEAGRHDNAYARVEVETPGCRVWGYASVIDENTGDPTTIPMVEE